MSLISGQIRQLALKLQTLDDESFTILNLNNLGQMANLDHILCVASLGEWKRLHNVLRLIGLKILCPWQ